MIISGKSHTVNSRRGVDSESEKNSSDIFRLLSQGIFINGKHVMLIAKLYIVELIHNRLLFDNHVRGISIIVGRIIFNI